MSPKAKPLAGRRIVVTRAREQASDLVDALVALGAEVIAAPTIRIEPLADSSALRAAFADLARYQWVIFTSQNTVRVVRDRLTAWGLGPGALAGVSVVAIVPATAEALTRIGVEPALVPERFVAEAVVDAIARRADGNLRGTRILLPQALEARDVLPEGLRAQGAVVDVIPVYRAVPETADSGGLAAELIAGRIDAVTFTASSTVQRFFEQVGREAATSGRFATAVIGPITARTARSLGLPVTVEAEQYTIPGLVEALVRHFGEEGRGKGEG
jgi:uroporphyrinogen III methyltransferase / synthase